MQGNKKIGITTIWGSPVNYGQILQSYALSVVLRRMGFSPYIIRYTSLEVKNDDTILKKIKRVVSDKNSISKIIHRIVGINEKKVDRGFRLFTRKYLAYSEDVYNSYEDLCENCPQADVFITGSDQVWGEWGTLNRKKVFLLDFVPNSKPRIAYAASFARNALKDEEVDIFRNSLSHFKAIGVREQSGIELCKSLGVNHVKWTTDPTVLLSRTDWIKQLKLEPINIGNNRRKSAVIYLLTNDERNKIVYKIIDYLEEKEYEVKYVSSARFIDKKAAYNPTIEMWLSDILNAELVITSSYHGMLFALNFNTPFITLVRDKSVDGQNSRIYSILNDLNLTHRIIDEFDKEVLDKIMKEPLNWNLVNNFLASQREEGLDFLKSALRDGAIN